MALERERERDIYIYNNIYSYSFFFPCDASQEQKVLEMVLVHIRTGNTSLAGGILLQFTQLCAHVCENFGRAQNSAKAQSWS